MAPIDPRKNVPISDPRLSSGEDVEGHRFLARLDTDEAQEGDVEAHRFLARLDTDEAQDDDVEAHRFLAVLDTKDGQTEGEGEPPLRSL